ncbi:MAG TPA: DUF4397 domain-containing protein [Anaerolineae bacterium]|nr:DUF4397 domain-containing protein [Anaerolineae bacterium]
MKRVLMLLTMLVLSLSMLFTPAAQAQGGGYAPENTARLRMVHASPDAPPVDVVVADRLVFRYVRFGDITFYAPLAAGQVNVKVLTADANRTEVINTNLDLTGDTAYTLLAVGVATNIEPLVLVDDNSLPEAGQAKIRFVNVSPDAPAVDVPVKNGEVLFDNVAFKSATDYKTVDANRYNLEVRSAGTPDVVLDVPWVGLRPGSVSTVFALGLMNGQPPLQAELKLDRRSWFGPGQGSGPGQGPGFRPGYCCQRPPVYQRPPCCRPNYNYGNYSFYGGWYYNHYPKVW